MYPIKLQIRLTSRACTMIGMHRLTGEGRSVENAAGKPELNASGRWVVKDGRFARRLEFPRGWNPSDVGPSTWARLVVSVLLRIEFLISSTFIRR